MLVQSATFWAELQVKNDEGPPSTSKVEHLACPFCLCRMHGHGWRRRYLVDAEGTTLRVWVHRVRCPRCGRTCTQVPQGVSLFKIYSVEVITNVVALCLASGHVPNRIRVSKHVAKRWLSHFNARCIHEGIPLSQKLKSLFIIKHPEAPPSVLVPKDRAEMARLKTRQGSTHHHWLLPAVWHVP